MDKKIKLRTIIIIIAVILFSIMLVIVFATNKGGKLDVSNETHNINYLNKIDKTEVNNEENEFDLNFLRFENSKKNIIYSPLSIKYALNMLKEGANGETRTQIEKVISNLSLTKYENIDKILSLANCIYIRDNYRKYIKEEYKNKLIEKYNSEVNYDAFENAENINKWIEKKTLGIIPNIIDDNTVNNPNTKMLLINALAIDMAWDTPFSTNKTRGADFYLTNGNKILATMMSKNTSDDNVLYYKDKKITALSMNLEKYENTQLQFIALMPSGNLPDYINNLTTDEIDSILRKLKPASTAEQGIDISIPKFSYKYDLKLKDDLIKLGIKSAFQESADFSGITTEPSGLYISDALHKADVKFGEEGIKAAAVTVFALQNSALPSTNVLPEEIIFDHPFVYLIRDKKTGEVWFTGALYEPNLWENDKVDYLTK